MLDTTKRTIATLTAAACLGGAGWAIASSSNGSSGGSDGTSVAADASIADSASGAPAYGAPPQQAQVTGEAAEKVKAAVLAEVPGATVERVEQDAQGYHAHITKADGTRATVRLNAQFEVTAVESGQGPGGPGGPDGRPCPEGAGGGGAGAGAGAGGSGDNSVPTPAPAAGESGLVET
jgi:hypothetical protein